MSALQWSESMSGRVSFDTDRLQPGLVAGHAAAPSISTSHVDDVERFFTDDEHEATCSGWIDCDGLGERMAIAEGTFNLLVAADGPRRREMRYRLFAHDRAGRPVTLAGVKDVEDGWFPRHVGRHDHAVHAPATPGWIARDAEDGATAAGHRGPARLRAAAFLALMLSMRGPLRDKLRYGSVLHRARCCRSTSGGAPPPARPTSPGCTPAPSAGRASRPSNGTSAPGGPGLRRRILAVRTEDGARAHRAPHPRRARSRPSGPVLLQHGTGVRANLFYGSPMPRSIVDVLVDGGFDVWLGNWRGSIDLPECDYTLDEVARYDHPALIAAVLRETGAQTLKAVVHCQGSTSFALACAGGLVPEVTDVVSNAVSFHVDVPRLSRLQHADAGAAAVARLSRASTRNGRCARPRCARACWPPGRARCAASAASPCARWPTTPTASAATSSGTTRTSTRPRTAGSPASSAGCRPPSSARCARCAAAGHLVAASGFDELPDDVVASPPRNRPRWTFLAGSANRCFLPRSQERSFAWLDGLEPGRHALVEVPGYTHLDLFFGRDAERDVFGHVRDALLRGTSNPRGS